MHFLVKPSLLIYVSCNFVLMLPPSPIPRPKEDLGMRLAPTWLSTTCSISNNQLRTGNEASEYMLVLTWTHSLSSIHVALSEGEAHSPHTGTILPGSFK